MVTSYITGNDMFGHPIRLNFKDRGTEHKTFAGGFVSIIVRLFLAFYFGLNLRKMIQY